MRKSTILHLSDLHISKFKSDYSSKLYDSRVESEDYVDNFCREVINIAKTHDLEIEWLIITGDLANTANKKEYAQVKSFLSKMQECLNIKKSNLLLIPGNHDIYRPKVQLCANEDDSKKPNMFFDEKLETYKCFYEEYMEDTFNCSDSILFYKEDPKNKILFLGINTLYNESHLTDDHIGMVEKESLRLGLEKIKKECSNYENLTKFALFHHPPEFLGAFEKSTIQNWKQIKPILDDYDIHVYVFGHVHSEEIEEVSTNIYLGTGSFALLDKDITNTFSLYSIENGQVSVKLYDFRPNPLKGTSGLGNWRESIEKKYTLFKEKIESKKINEDVLIKDQDKESLKSPFGVGKITFDMDEESFQVENHSKNIEEDSQKNNLLSQNFINKIQDEDLFQSGHFHWGDNLKAHGWLNTNKMLGKFQNIQLSVNSILYYIEKYKIDVDTIIGIGMEGNILGSILAINLGKRYTYVPSKEHGKHEKAIDLTGTNKVLFITDTIFTGNTIHEVLEQYNDEFEKVQNKSLISIFCTGDIQKIEAKLKHKIKIYSLCNEIKIELCKRNKEDCPISKYNLDIIHEL